MFLLYIFFIICFYLMCNIQISNSFINNIGGAKKENPHVLFLSACFISLKNHIDRQCDFALNLKIVKCT